MTGVWIVTRGSSRPATFILALVLAAVSGSCSNGKGGNGGTGGFVAVDPDAGDSPDQSTVGPTFGKGDGGSTTDGGIAPPPGDGFVQEDVTSSGVLPCDTDGDCPPGAPHCAPAKLCFQCIEDAHCGADHLCKNGVCKGLVCTPGDRMCNGPLLQVCMDDGTGYDEVSCAPGTCSDGQCQGCTPGTTKCELNSVMQCDDGGTFQLWKECSGDEQCLNGDCRVCYPGTPKCDGNDTYKCADDGKSWEFQQSCGGGMVCLGGQCQSLCSADLKFNTNVGCDYWAVDLDNAGADPPQPGQPAIPGADNAQFAIVVSNVGEKAATVKIRKAEGGQPDAEAEVPPGGLHIFNLPAYNVDGTMQGARAWRVEATAPIVAYQFNPLENEGVFSNDASVLLPSNTWGTEYIVMTRGQLSNKYRGYVTIIASLPDTTVNVKVSAATLAGGAVPALKKGDVYTATLQPYEVLNIESNADGADLTGTEVTSDKPVAVFGGHEAAVTGQECCADHLEMQMLPVPAWGKTYVASKSAPRGAESDYFRILASEDGTTVITTPPQGGIPTLKRGQFHEIKSTQSFVIDATKPVLVGQYLASSFEIEPTQSCFSKNDCPAGYDCSLLMQCEPPLCFGGGNCPQGHTCSAESGSCEPIGDPAFILAVPVEQFRSEYTFLAPSKYLQDYVNVIAPTGVDVLLDGVSIAGQLKTVNASFAAAQVSIKDEVHTIEAVGEAGIGIVVYGYDDDVSYGYPGGMSIKKLTP